MALSTLGRAALVAAIMIGLAPAPAAAAAPPAVDVLCESLGRYRILCQRTITGGTAPYYTQWFYNGGYFPGYDNKTFTSWGCTVGASNQYTAVVTDATGLSAADAGIPFCYSGNP